MPDPVVEPVPGTPEYDAAMIAKADAGVDSIKSIDERGDAPEGSNFELNQEEADGDKDGDKSGDSDTKRPDNIPEKFWDAKEGKVNVEALLKSQADGEAAILAAAAKAKEGDKPNEPTTLAAKEAVDKASLEFSEKGELSAETYETLEKSGYDRATVDSYIAGQVAIAGQIQTAAWGPFGDSKEQYDEAADWAAEKLTDAQLEALDVQITSSNPAIVAEGAKALRQIWVDNADIDPERNLTGDSGNGDNVTGSYYKSSAEMQKDMSSKKYETDAAFRAEVAGKIDRADKKGINLYG